MTAKLEDILNIQGNQIAEAINLINLIADNRRTAIKLLLKTAAEKNAALFDDDNPDAYEVWRGYQIDGWLTNGPGTMGSFRNQLRELKAKEESE
jgi:hypothetical protein